MSIKNLCEKIKSNKKEIIKKSLIGLAVTAGVVTTVTVGFILFKKDPEISNVYLEHDLNKDLANLLVLEKNEDFPNAHNVIIEP